MKKLIASILIAITTSNVTLASNNEYSNYNSCMSPKRHKVVSMSFSNKKEKLEKLEAILGVLSVVSLTSVYYLSDNKSLVPYSIPLGLALGSFTIGIANK
jgi:hypothetical protein